jgi:photosystem II stability/assembly factor-like uncharacterized protein
MKKILWIVLLAAACAVPDRSLAQWVQTGGPLGGYINSVAEDDSFLYAATFGPIFRMQKGTTTWAPLPLANWRVEGTSCLLVAGTTLYAGNPGGGVFWSTDRGVMWNRWISGLEDAQNVFSFAMRGDDLYAGTNSGVYLSTDGGANWTARNTGQDSLLVTSLLFKDTIFFAATLNGGVYRSTDYGAHWSAANDGLSANVVWSLAVVDTILYAGTWGMEGVHRSTDDGLTWQVFEDGPYKLVDVNALVVMGTTILAGTVWHGVYRSEDGGPWEQLHDGPASVACFHVSGTELVAGTFDGVYLSPDTGDSWNASYSGLKGSIITTLLHDGTHLFAGTRSSGLFRSDDGGASWTKAHYYSDVTSLAAIGGYCYVASPQGVGRSTDGGIHWDQAGLSDGAMALAVLPRGSDSSYLFAGIDSSGVFLSTDNGNSWAQLNSGLTDTMIRCLAVMDTSLFAGTGSGVFLSSDKGTSWAPVNKGLTETDIQCFAVGGTSLFAGTKDGGVFRTTDTGTAWSAVNNGLADLEVISLAARGTNVFAGTRSGGVFVSENSGATWARADTGLRPLGIQALALDESTVYAGSRGYSVWRRPLQEMVTAVNGPPEGQPRLFNLGQNYPNPFNPSTTITYELPGTMEVRLVVYDVLGREVSVLVQERKGAGIHKVALEGRGLSSGVYFYRLIAGSFIQTKKLLLVR